MVRRRWRCALGAVAAWTTLVLTHGWSSLTFARKHVYPTGMYDLQRSLESRSMSMDERMATLISLKNTYDERIDVYGRRREWSTALNFLDEMRARDISPDAATYEALFKALGSRAHQWTRVLHLLGEMQEAGFDVTPTAMTWAVCAPARVKGRWKKALEVFWTLRRQVPRPQREAYSFALYSSMKAKCWEDALALVDEMEELHLWPKSRDWNLAIDACFMAREDEWCEFLTDRAASHGVELIL